MPGKNGKPTMIPRRYERILFSFLMSSFMSFFMSGIITWINLGFVDHFVLIWLEAFWKAFTIAFPTVFFVVPAVRKLTMRLLRAE